MAVLEPAHAHHARLEVGDPADLFSSLVEFDDVLPAVGPDQPMTVGRAIAGPWRRNSDTECFDPVVVVFDDVVRPRATDQQPSERWRTPRRFVPVGKSEIHRDRVAGGPSPPCGRLRFPSCNGIVDPVGQSRSRDPPELRDASAANVAIIGRQQPGVGHHGTAVVRRGETIRLCQQIGG